jgi:hypothetical protein
MYDRVTQSGIAPQKVGVAGMPGLTLFRDSPNYHEAPTQEFDEATAAPPPGAPHLWLAALLVLVAALWIVNQHVKFGPLNLAFVVLVTMAGFVLLKAIFGKYHVPGLSQVVLAA